MPCTNKIGLAADHAGYELKEEVKAQLIARGLQVEDYGCHSAERCDYPDYAHPMGRAIQEGTIARGISICGSGNGIAMVLNKYPRVRAALCWSVELAKLAREHNDANVLALGGRVTGFGPAGEIVRAWIRSEFEGGRHTRRVEKMMALQDQEGN